MYCTSVPSEAVLSLPLEYLLSFRQKNDNWVLVCARVGSYRDMYSHAIVDSGYLKFDVM